MKKILLLLLCSFFILFSSNQSASAVKITINWSESNIQTSKEVTREEIFNYLATFIWDTIPSSYKYINLEFQNIDSDSELYDSLQKLVYLDLIKNTDSDIHVKKKLNLYWFLRISEKVLWFNLINSKEVEDLKSKNTTKDDFNKLELRINKDFTDFKNQSKVASIKQKKAIFLDVYNTLLDEHYNKGDFKEVEIINSAIEWITNGLNDKHTVYFPPTESKAFSESLEWEYEWIWSYVDMETPGNIRIISPITGSPSQKAWLKWGDLIIKVDGKEIKVENSLWEVVTWIKWPAGSKVTLTIKRWEKIFDIDVIRGKIVIINVESKLLTKDTYYIQIKSFWDNVSENFKKALEWLKERKRVKKVIIDLRNNGWWYLWEVADMLSYFVEEWKPTAVVKYTKWEQEYNSKGYDLLDFSNYKIVILQNSWTASASEILIWTLQDYMDNITVIWENSYGKGSVQTIRGYKDGSTLKYTIAKWFTWKTQTGIDGIWITPDIELEFDIEKFKKDWSDNQLDAAKLLK